MKKKTYYKGLDENLCGLNGFQYEVGKEYNADTPDKFHWLHFAEKVSYAFRHGPRVVEAEPLTPANRYSSDDLNAERIRIVRELSRDEIMDTLVAEKYPFNLIAKMKPSYEQILRHKNCIKRDHYPEILHWDRLTADQKRNLLPKSWERYIRMQEERGK